MLKSLVKYSSCWKVKAYRVSLMMQTFQNDLGFSLYITLSICYMVVTSEDWNKV